MEEVKKEVAAGTATLTKIFQQVLKNGTKINLQMAVEISDYAVEDFEDLLNGIAQNSKNFYLSSAGKLNSKL